MQLPVAVMRFRQCGAALASLLLVTASCADVGVLQPDRPDARRDALPVATSLTAAAPAVRFSELHYDNVGTDAGEAIELSGPAGQSVQGWSVVLYNGANGAPYDTRALTGVFPATCRTRGVIVLTYGVNGIQNGSPDGMALVDDVGNVVEFLSYEGTFTAVGGAADGLLSHDIGVAEGSATPIGHSLARSNNGSWNAEAPNSFGTCNDDGDPLPPADVESVEISPDSASVSVGGTQQFIASALDADGQIIPSVTFTWTSLDRDIATVSATGLAAGVDVGSTRIVVAAANGAADTATLIVSAAPPPPPSLPSVRFTEIHYDNFGTDVGEAIEIEGPAGTNVTGWSIVLYNGSGGAVYNTQTLSGTLPTQCDGRGTLVVNYPVNGIQNGAPDGFALVDNTGALIEFLSYEGTFVGVGGAANGVTSVDIIANQEPAPAIGISLQRDVNSVWTSAPRTFGSCNEGATPPPPVGKTISITGRSLNDPPLPVGFEDQLFATLRDGTGAVIPTVFTWSSETPALARIDAFGVVRALGAGDVIVRATADDGTTRTFTLPTRVATRGTAQYASHAEFGEPADADASDDFIVRRTEFTASWNRTLGTPNWVSYNLDATHFGNADRCDCFTFDPLLPADFPQYTTASYTGSGAVAGFGIDRGHLARSFDRTSGSLDNANSYYFTNIVPQAADLNQGPWSAFEIYLGNLARFDNKEVFVVTGVSGSIGSLKNEGIVNIPAFNWKVAVILPRDQGLSDIGGADDVEVVAVWMPNSAGIRNVDWRTYLTLVDSVEARSGYDLLALLRDDIEIAVESGTRRPIAATDGPYSALPNMVIAMSAAGSTDPDGDALTYRWSFGDGQEATGVSVTHSYASSGVKQVRLIATDIRGLADTVFTTATITAPAEALGQGLLIVDGLVDEAIINAGVGVSLNAKLMAAISSLERGNTVAAINQLRALRNQLDALTGPSGRLSTRDVAPLYALIDAVLTSLRS